MKREKKVKRCKRCNRMIKEHNKTELCQYCYIKIWQKEHNEGRTGKGIYKRGSKVFKVNPFLIRRCSNE